MKCLIVKANTNSEWDPVSFAVIGLNEEYIRFLKQAQKDAEEISKRYSHGFMYLTLSGDMADFYVDENEIPVSLYEDKPVVSEVEDSIIDKLTNPEQDIRHGVMRISANSIRYVGYGKHTDEEFWTEDIPFEIIFK